MEKMNKQETLGITICTYNNRDLVIDCVKSIFDSDFSDYMIYLVDNASSDGTYDALTKTFSGNSKLKIIRNEENLGCSGGFDTGIRAAYNGKHKYIACLDSDIRLRKDALSVLCDYLEKNDDVAVAGSRVMYMDQPDVIQWIGSHVKYGEKFEDVFGENILDDRRFHPKDVLYFGAFFDRQGTRYNNDLDEVIECDLLPACAYVFRSCVIDSVGFWDTSYFLYWDETDWQKRVKEAGWKLVCCTDSVVWHKNGSFQPTNTRALYYSTRNVVKFFGKYVEKEKLEHLSRFILWSNFQRMYACNYKGIDGVIRTVMIAIDDAVHGIGGACQDGRIFDRNIEQTDFLMNGLKDSNSVLLVLGKKYDSEMARSLLFRMIIKIRRLKNVKICISADLDNDAYDQFEDRAEFVDNTDGDYDLRLRLCAHVNVDLPEWENDWIIVDPTGNYIDNYNGWLYFSNFQFEWNLFYNSHKDILLDELIEYHEKSNSTIE